MARAIPSKEASSVVHALTNVVLTYGAPKRIISDQGREFNNEVLWYRQALCILYISVSSHCAKSFFF